MSWRRLAITLIALLTAVVSLTGVASLAYAAPQATFGPPMEGTKVTLADTSIDGPALMRTYSPATVIAWTGRDAAHHLNLMTSSDGLQYGNKITLPETSLWRPAIAFIDTGRGAPYYTILLAWTGTDKAHTLNLEFIQMPGYKVTQKITFWGETSFTAPALASVNHDVNSDVYLAWAGDDSAHTLNVIRLLSYPLTQTKYTLWGWSSISRPNLSTDQSDGSDREAILSWTGTNNRIYFAATTDKVNWTMPSTSPLTVKSAWAPSMIGFYATALPTHWLAWTGDGTTSVKSINVRYTQNYPSWSDTNAQTTLAETAMSSPELAYNGDGSTTTLLIAWAGTDTNHHLNVAKLSA